MRAASGAALLLSLLPLAAAAAGSPSALQDRPGERVVSEDARLGDFHRVDIGRPEAALYRSASPVREIIKEGASGAAAVRQADAVMRRLRARGVRTIVSLEDPGDPKKGGKIGRSVALEKAAAERAGIAFHPHPMRNEKFFSMSDAQVLAWLAGVKKDLLASSRGGAVLYHCAAGHDRTGLVTAYLRVTEQGWPVEKAIAELRSYGHNWVKFSRNGGKSSWHEDFLRRRFASQSSDSSHANFSAVKP